MTDWIVDGILKKTMKMLLQKVSFMNLKKLRVSLVSSSTKICHNSENLCILMYIRPIHNILSTVVLQKRKKRMY